jgi:hypothetical protein
MESLLKLIFGFLDKHTIWELIAYISLFILLCFIILGFKLLWIKIRKPKHNIKVTQANLAEHHMFYSLKTYLSYEIQQLYIPERLRNAIFKDLLIFKLTSIRHSFENFLKRGDLEKLTPGAFHTRMLECVNEILRRYEAKALEEKIPQIVIDRFNQWHSDRIKQMYETINDVCDDESFSNNSIRTKIIFDSIVVVINWTISDARKTLINLNGELNKVEYKGITVDPNYLLKSLGTKEEDNE